MVQHIWRDSRECEIHTPKFTQKFTLDSQIHENVKFARNSYEFVRIWYEFRANFVRIRTNGPQLFLVTAICCTHWILNNLFCRSLDTR